MMNSKPLFRSFFLSFRGSFPSFRRKPESSETRPLAERSLDWVPRSRLGHPASLYRLRPCRRSRGMTKLRGGMTGLNSAIARLRGFTLLEVMIALLVITLGMGAVINTTSESGWKSAQLRQKTIGTWVAQNQVTRYRANRVWGDANSQSGKVEMANVNWIWRMKISATDDPSLRRLDVEVFIEGEEGLKASITGFIARL